MKGFYLITLLLLTISCSSSQRAAKRDKCPKIYKNNYTKILNEKYKTIYNKDTVTYNQIKFECVYSSFYTHKVMYDKFGKWDNVIYPSNNKYPILMWEKVNLFSDGKEYTILTTGIEEWKHIYASVMVFDKNEVDLLSADSKEREKLTNYFANLIKNQNLEKKDFYELFWKMVDPDYWKTIEEHRKKYPPIGKK